MTSSRAFAARVALFGGLGLAIYVSSSCKTAAPFAAAPTAVPTFAPTSTAVVAPTAAVVIEAAQPTSVPATPTPPRSTPPEAKSGRAAVAPVPVPMRITPAPPAARASPAAQANASPPPVQTGTLTGKIELLGPDRKVVPAQDVVVWAPGVPASRQVVGKPTLKSQDKRFAPHVVVVTKGSTVTFPNVDKIYHNVFSRTAGSEFDLGLYRGGASKDNRFDKPGLVRIFCNIHPQMAGYVMVLDDVPHAVTNERGVFVLTGLPPGRHKVQLWHEKGGERTVEVEVRPGSETPLAVQLDGSGFKDVPHKNKLGLDYPKGRDDERY